MSDIVYSWNFNPLEIVYNEEGMTDVIQIVHWQYTATLSIETGSVQQRIVGNVSLPTPVIGSFIPFAEVTKEMVTQWVVTTLGNENVEQMQQNLKGLLEYQLAPTKGTVAPPWA